MNFDYSVPFVPQSYDKVVGLGKIDDPGLRFRITVTLALYNKVRKQKLLLDDFIRQSSIDDPNVFRKVFKDRGGSIIAIAAGHHQSDLLSKMIEKFGNALVNISDSNGFTPLFYASHKILLDDPQSEHSIKTYETVKVLLKNGAKVPSWETGCSPIRVIYLYNRTLPTLILLIRQVGLGYWHSYVQDPIKLEKKLLLKEKCKQIISGRLVTDKEVLIYQSLRGVICLTRDVVYTIIKFLIVPIDGDLDDHFIKNGLHAIQIPEADSKQF